MEGARAPGSKPGSRKKVADKRGRYALEVPEGKDLWHHVQDLEKEMFEAAKNLEFEKAAQLRDTIHQLKEKSL